MPSYRKRADKDCLVSTLKPYRDQMFNSISRTVVRHSMLPKNEKLFVIKMIRHKIEENEL